MRVARELFKGPHVAAFTSMMVVGPFRYSHHPRCQLPRISEIAGTLGERGGP